MVRQTNINKYRATTHLIFRSLNNSISNLLKYTILTNLHFKIFVERCFTYEIMPNRRLTNPKSWKVSHLWTLWVRLLFSHLSLMLYLCSTLFVVKIDTFTVLQKLHLLQMTETVLVKFIRTTFMKTIFLKSKWVQ